MLPHQQERHEPAPSLLFEDRTRRSPRAYVIPDPGDLEAARNVDEGQGPRELLPPIAQGCLDNPDEERDPTGAKRRGSRLAGGVASGGPNGLATRLPGPGDAEHTQSDFGCSLEDRGRLNVNPSSNRDSALLRRTDSRTWVRIDSWLCRSADPLL